MPVERARLFTDFTCPFSHVTEAILRRVAEEWEGTVEYVAFELYPAPVALPLPAGEAEWPEGLRSLAAEAGVRIAPPPAVPRTRKAHEAARFAAGAGREEALRDAIFRAYWEEGRDIGRIDVLTSIGSAVGLDREALRIALDIDAFADAVAEERAEAERIGVIHTPTLVVGEGDTARWAVGALPARELEAVLRGGSGG